MADFPHLSGGELNLDGDTKKMLMIAIAVIVVVVIIYLLYNKNGNGKDKYAKFRKGRLGERFRRRTRLGREGMVQNALSPMGYGGLM